VSSSGKWISVCSFKHNGLVHRLWNRTLVLYEDEDFLVVGNDDSTVYEADGRSWKVKEPAVTFFFKKHWYNIIAMLRETGIHYYCNIASPYTKQNDNVIYVDYDLDLSIKPNQPLKILDEIEYQRHRKELGYSLEIDYKIKEGMYDLMERYQKKEFPFKEEKIFEYYNTFLKLKSED